MEKEEYEWKDLFVPNTNQIRFDGLKEEFSVRWNNCKPSPQYNFDEKYEIVNTIGRGVFADWILAKQKDTKKYYFTKVLLKEKLIRRNIAHYAFQEKKVLSAIRYPFAIALEFSIKDNDCLYIGLEFPSAGNLFTLHKTYGRFSERHAKFYAAQVYLALEYLHYLDLIFRAIKPENIAIDCNGYIRLFDFAFTKKIKSGRTWTFCGTPEYMAPEIIQLKSYGKSTDWWAFGVLCYELVNGTTPFASPTQDILEICANIVDCKLKIPQFFSKDLKDLISNIFQTDISRRFGNLKNGPKDIKKHNWFKSVNWIDILKQNVDAPHALRKDCRESFNWDKYAPIQRPKSSNNLYEKEFEDF